MMAVKAAADYSFLGKNLGAGLALALEIILPTYRKSLK